MPRVCVLLAPGFEEIEAVTVLDVLRRAEIDTVAIGVSELEPSGTHGIEISADRPLEGAEKEHWDLVVLPGGMPGAGTLRDSPEVQNFLRAQAAAGVKIAAICAAPIALAKAGLLEGRRATSYPSFADELAGADYREENVVIDGPIITSRGPGTAMAFALTLVEVLRGREVRDGIARGMLVAPR